MAVVDRPVEVRRAVILLWVSLIGGFIASAGDFVSALAEESEVGWLFLGVFFLGGFLLMAIPILFVARRRNWARIVILVLTIAGVAAEFWFPPEGASLREWIVEIGLTSAELLALFWLFTGPGAVWFSRRA